MANLFGSDIGLNYKGILNLGATVNQNVSGSLQYLTDGDGNNLPIQVSTTGTQLNYGVGIGGAPTGAGLQVYGQAGTTGLIFGGAAATMYIDLNGSGINFFDAAETRYRNFAGTTLAMNVRGDLGRVAIGGVAASPYTPSASLQVRGDGTNPMFIVETSAGNAVLSANATGNNLTFSAASVTATSATNTVFSLTSTFGAAAGSANYRPLSIAYTINNTGAQTGNTTGIFLNATETALNSMTHNLLDLQVGGVSQFKVGRDGRITTSNSYMTFNNNTNVLFGVDTGGFLYYQGGNRFLVSSTGLIYGYNDLRNTGNIVAGGISITPLARLHVRGDGTNSIAIFETNAGASVLTVVNGGVLINTTLGFYCNFLYPASSNTIALEGKANLVASTISRASLSIRTGVAPTAPVNGDIWFDGTNLFMRIGGVTKTFTLTP